ncbi:MAG: pirin family protein [Rhodospirillaceae bacterium]|nr:pirin family protein [Rhodospirillaceae bacterium]
MTGILQHIIEGRGRDIGIPVRRILPAAGHRHVGPFVFLDHMGPVAFSPGQGMDVRPHPHIGLATVTYLFEGEILHRDSLGVVQPIRPGDVNWMTAGRGIVHSERSDPALRARGFAMHGIQSWVALPKAHEEDEPWFRHHPAASLPMREAKGLRLRIVAGTLLGLEAPVAVASPTLYADLALEPGAEFVLPAEHPERAVYVAKGSVSAGSGDIATGQLGILAPGEPVTLTTKEGCRAMLVGGSPVDGERFLWWNFVSSSLERIEQAKKQWADGGFPPVPGETEFIPLPDDPPPRVRRPAG